MKRTTIALLLVVSHVLVAGVACAIVVARHSQRAVQSLFTEPDFRLGWRLLNKDNSGLAGSLEADLELLTPKLPKGMPDVIRLAASLNEAEHDPSAMVTAEAKCRQLGWSHCDTANLAAMQKALKE